MELSLIPLGLPTATVPIPIDGVDPYKAIQVHDYKNVLLLSFSRSLEPRLK
jgi:phosphatidylinositol transfer protein SFH5